VFEPKVFNAGEFIFGIGLPLKTACPAFGFINSGDFTRLVAETLCPP
jgi:hypothetical protein